MDARSNAPATLAVASGGSRGSAMPSSAGFFLPATSSTSLTRSVTGVHDFKVTSFSLLDEMGIGRCVRSSTFSVGGYVWAVWFYPDGNMVDFYGRQTTSAFLYYCGRDAGVRTRFALGLLRRDGEMSQHATNSCIRHTFSPTNSRCGFVRFVPKHRLRQQGSPYVVDDCLTIRCVLTVVKGSTTVDTSETNSIFVPGPSNQLHLDFQRMLENGEYTDVTFTVDGQVFNAHRCVLASRSSVFRAQLFGSVKDNNASRSILIEDMEPLIFELLLHFIYTDYLPYICDDCRNPAMQHLLVAADRYGVERLISICESTLSEAIDVETVATTLVLAEQHNRSQLRRACIGFIASSPKVLGPVMKTDGFKHLTESCPLVMKEILEHVSLVGSNQSG